jgi:hypothetical protein
MKCPKCGSEDVVAWTLVHGYAHVDMQTGEVEDPPEECDYDANELDEFECRVCDHEW